ncbi:RsmD family RNA methyltransferase [Candidatus Hepatobacter penaei]|uniref:RsmD family RNA methyltransferase n=1 Tax=Candidatus Hepatobacter penaei TaxID=1274402 RepID=UPI0009E3807B|nr:RsmD family RNA methyltransferase [Candidatus Hepatobacter penaei]
MMRILQGRLKGRKLAPHDPWVRPTSSYRREMIFNRLMHADPALDLPSCRVLDVFAGTGSLGLEALSRGAAFVTFVEPQATTRHKLDSFLKTHDLTTCTSLLACAVPHLPPCTMPPYHLCFLDAPYGQALIPPALDNLHRGHWLTPRAVLIAETDKREALPLPPFITLEHTTTKGRTHVHFMSYMPALTEEDAS